MSRAMRFLCGTPKDHCTGGILHTDQNFSTDKCHSSRKEAMRCFGRYLESQGYTKLSNREYRDKDGSIRILPKQSKFGGRLRQGKGEQGSRFEPERGSGLIV